jgi:hypothetical protein
MRGLGVGAIALCVFALVAATAHVDRAQAQRHDGAALSVPKTWDDAAMATPEVPLANAIGSPQHVSADYYYPIPVRPIYRSYPIYAPGHEPPGYVNWLKRQEPVIVLGDKDHRPPLETQADWLKGCLARRGGPAGVVVEPAGKHIGEEHAALSRIDRCTEG